MVGNDGLPHVAVYSRGIVQGKQDNIKFAVVLKQFLFVPPLSIDSKFRKA